MGRLTRRHPLREALARFRADSAARGGLPCNYPECGCEFDAVCHDAILDQKALRATTASPARGGSHRLADQNPHPPILTREEPK